MRKEKLFDRVGMNIVIFNDIEKLYKILKGIDIHSDNLMKIHNKLDKIINKMNEMREDKKDSSSPDNKGGQE